MGESAYRVDFYVFGRFGALFCAISGLKLKERHFFMECCIWKGWKKAVISLIHLRTNRA